MGASKSALQFLGYCVDELVFLSKPEFVEAADHVVLNPTFTRRIKQVNPEEYEVSIGSKLEQEDLPFEVRLSLTGRFKCEGVSDVQRALKVNAVAILYPYVRATLSLLTTLAAVPPVVVPTINLAKMFEQEEQTTPLGTEN